MSLYTYIYIHIVCTQLQSIISHSSVYLRLKSRFFLKILFVRHSFISISIKFPKNYWQTYVASFLLAILVRSSKVVEAAMVVAFIIPRVKSTVALRAVGHLAMWLL